MANLDYYTLAEAFFRFKRVANKFHFYSDEVNRMEQSIREMDPLHDNPEQIVSDMEGAKKINDSI